MKASTANERRDQLCGCLLTREGLSPDAWFEHEQVDLIEWRLDRFFEGQSIGAMVAGLTRLNGSERSPVLVTCRSAFQGGIFAGSKRQRFSLFEAAIAAGADWLDLEYDVDEEFLPTVRAAGVHWLLSSHDFNQTPSRDRLHALAEEMAAHGADALKIVTHARASADASRVLELISYGQNELKVPTIAFCMGDTVRWTRVVCCLMGSPWTYVRLRGQPEAAPGQLNARDMRTLLANLRAGQARHGVKP